MTWQSYQSEACQQQALETRFEGEDELVEPPTRRAPGPRVLRVFFDHGHQWPLWESGTDKYTMEPSDYGFSEELTELLRRWHAAWESVADFDIGQPVAEPSEQDRNELRSLRCQTIAVIRCEVPPGVEVRAE